MYVCESKNDGEVRNDTQVFVCVPGRVGALSPREHMGRVEWGPAVGFPN